MAFDFSFIYLRYEGGSPYLFTRKSSRKKQKKIGKRELTLWEGKGRPPVYKQVQKESDWKTYYGSHEFIKTSIKEGKHDEFQREILQLAFSKKELTYLENKWLFSKAVLETEDYLNDNIEGRYFKKDFGF